MSNKFPSIDINLIKKANLKLQRGDSVAHRYSASLTQKDINNLLKKAFYRL